MRVSISKKFRISSFFVHSDVNLVTLVLFASLNGAVVVLSYIFKKDLRYAPTVCLLVAKRSGTPLSG